MFGQKKKKLTNFDAFNVTNLIVLNINPMINALSQLGLGPLG